jgi:DNA-binding SARP family transcriptional activator/TolB-like protein
MLRLRTLGGVALENGEEGLTGSVAQGRRLALLTIIAASNGSGVSRDRLIGLLWPESETTKARQVLTQWLHLIRRDLNEDHLFIGTAALRLNPERLTSDIGDLAAALNRGDLESAAHLYAGSFLDGFYLSGASAEFEHWVEEERARLVTRMRVVYETLVRQAAERGDHDLAVRWSERLAALDPLDGRGALVYMRALANAGERECAIRHARVHASLVRSELDAEPDADVEQLAAELRSRCAAVQPSRHPSPGVSNSLADRSPASSSNDVGVVTTMTRRRPRWSVATRAAIVVTIGAIAVGLMMSAVRLPRDAATRIMVAPFENETGDASLEPLGHMAADWIVRGVGETGLLEITAGETPSALLRAISARTRAARAGAGTLITGRYYRQGDSLAFQAEILDVARDRVLIVAGPVIVDRTRALDAVEELRRRIMGGVAALVDPSFAPLGSLVAAPPSYEAFRELSEGNAASRLRIHNEAIVHYRRALALDSTYLFPFVQMAHEFGTNYDCMHVDSIARELAPKRTMLTRYEDLLLRREEQTCAGDLTAAYRSGKELFELWPSSGITRMYLAKDASALNRPHEVLSLLMPSGDSVQPQRMEAYFLASLAFHETGDHAAELKTARAARARFADLLEPLMFEGRALTALNDMQGVRTVVEAVLSRREMAAPHTVTWTVADVLTILMDELRAHGHEADAAFVATQLTEWLDRHPAPAGNSSADFEHLMARFNLAVDALQWRAAVAFLDTLQARHATRLETMLASGRLAAYRGDTSKAEQVSTALAQFQTPYLHGENTLARAQIAALSGQRERAVALIRDALAEGRPYNTYRAARNGGFYHAHPDFQSLRGYAAFEALLRSRD